MMKPLSQCVALQNDISRETYGDLARVVSV